MRATPKLSQTWPHASFMFSSQSRLYKVLAFSKKHSAELAVVIVIIIAASGFVLGAAELWMNRSQIMRHPVSTLTVGNVMAHTSTSGDSATAEASTPHSQAAAASSPHQATTTSTTTGTSTVSDSTSGNSVTSTTTDVDGNTTVTVNGQTIPVPSSGFVSHDVVDTNGTTSVQVTHTSQSSNSNDTSLNVQVNSTSHGSNQ